MRSFYLQQPACCTKGLSVVCVGYGYLSSVDSVICISCTLFEGTKKGKQIIQDEDMKALLAAPPDTQKGNRDRMIMILLYDTAIRIAELLELKISSLKLTSVPSIHIHGKGDKERSVSITDATVSHLKKYLRQFLLRMIKRQLTEMRSFIVQTASMYARTKLQNLVYLFLYSLEQTASMTAHVHSSVQVQRWM